MLKAETDEGVLPDVGTDIHTFTREQSRPDDASVSLFHFIILSLCNDIDRTF